VTSSNTGAPPVPSAPETRAQRLRSSADVRAAFAARRAAGSAVAIVHQRRRCDAEPARFTVVAGKAIGNAVQRNRAKRRLRATAAGLPLQPGCDYVIVARAGALSGSAEDLGSALAAQVRSLERRQ